MTASRRLAAIGTGTPAIHYRVMPIFYLHVCDGGGFVEDLDGQHHPTVEAARTAAVTGLRDLLSGELRNGTLNMASFIEIEDESHMLVATVSFEDAVRTSTEIARPAPTLTIRLTD
jgi:hypothetical protein